MRNDVPTTRCDGALQHHVIVRITQERAPQEMHILQARHRCEVAQEAKRHLGTGVRGQMLRPREGGLPLRIKRHRERDLEFATRNHRQQLKTCPATRASSRNQDRGIQNDAQNSLVAPVIPRFYALVGSKIKRLWMECISPCAVSDADERVGNMNSHLRGNHGVHRSRRISRRSSDRSSPRLSRCRAAQRFPVALWPIVERGALPQLQPGTRAAPPDFTWPFTRTPAPFCGTCRSHRRRKLTPS